MSLSTTTANQLARALGSPAGAANEIATILANSTWGLPAAIVATSTSTTTNFSALIVGDLLVHIPATAGNAAFETVATAATKPSAAVVGDLYLVVRLNTNAPVTAQL
jgi:hypothetical protein